MMSIHDLLNQYVDKLKARGCIRSSAVEQAFRIVERHRLIESFYQIDYESSLPIRIDVDPTEPDPLVLEQIYSDRALVIRWQEEQGPTSSTSQPCLVALMIEALDLARGLNVLEIGTGTGYNAALMAEIVGSPDCITTIDIQTDVAAQARRLLAALGYKGIHVLARDGFFGAPEYMPFARIIATVGCPDLSPHWVEQLTSDGFMLIPLQHGGEHDHPLMKVRCDQNKLLGHVVDWSGFMTIQGELRASGLWEPAPWRDACKGTPACHTYPLFPALPAINQAQDYQARFDFHYFLALNDRRAFWGEAGVGLWDKSLGTVVIAHDQIKLYGEEKLYRELATLYEHWERLGCPHACNFQSEFLLNSEPRSQPCGPRPLGKRSWEIERKFFTQRVLL